ncbi:MAG: EamA family transporter [Alicyclobacillus sp.]|nr:EamA family transporter [Alicyclobacillus sp.]
MNVVLIALNICLLVAGQTLWKLGLAAHPLRGLGSAVLALFTPYILSGIVLYAIATVVWIYLLSRLPISLLYPLQSLAYVLTAVVALVFFQEHISATRWIGIGVILVGVALVVK